MKKAVKKAALAKKAANTKKSVAKEKVATKAKAVAAKAKSKIEKAKPKAKVAPVAKPVVKKTILTKVTGHLKHAKPVHAAPAAVVKPVAAAVKPVAAPVAVVAKPAVPAAPAAPKKLAFKIGELVVYPAHGVGKITAIEEQEIAGSKLELYIVDFEQKGMRRLADRGLIEHAMKVIRGRARIKRTMWSRRAQEYDAKINSGDLIAVAEVVRDLYRSDRQPEQSYSERQLFEQALLRMARELAAVRKVDDDQSVKELSEFLAKNAKRAQAAGEKAEEEAAAEEAA
jgi:CarD family transcriptional regulator